MSLALLRAAIKAASLHALAISAPENPGVCLASRSKSIFLAVFKSLI